MTRPYSANPFAQCPDCEGWYRVEWCDDIPPGGWWWKDSGSCPGCGAIVCVESECAFRGGHFDERRHAADRARLEARIAEIRAGGVMFERGE